MKPSCTSVDVADVDVAMNAPHFWFAPSPVSSVIAVLVALVTSALPYALLLHMAPAAKSAADATALLLLPIAFASRQNHGGMMPASPGSSEVGS